MSNCEQLNLPLIEVEPHQVRELLRCVLHTIIFNRALGHVKPRDVDSELFDITYVHCGDEEVDRRVESKISEFCQFVERKAGEAAQLTLAFYEKRRRQVSWFGKQDDRHYWEQWVVNISILQPDVASYESSSLKHNNPRAQRQARLQASMEELMACIIRAVNDKKGHIPPVSSPGTMTFPFDITISGASRSLLGLPGAVKRMLSQTMPPPVLG